MVERMEDEYKAKRVRERPADVVKEVELTCSNQHKPFLGRWAE